MTRQKPKGWPERGCLQIGYNDQDELERIRVLLHSLVFGTERLPYWVWDKARHEWVQLCFHGTLTKFQLRGRHPTRPYMDAKRGPVFKHMLVCHVAEGELAALKECIEHRLSFDSLLAVSACYKGALVKRVWEYHVSSADHSLRLSKLCQSWLCKGIEDVDEFEARAMVRVSITVREDPEWATDAKGAAKNPWKARYMIDIRKEPCGFQVGGGKYSHHEDGFASLEAAQAAGDGAKAALLTREEMRRRDVYVEEWHKWKSGKSNCSFRPCQHQNCDDATRFDPDEPRDAAYDRAKQQHLCKVRAAREKKQAARAAARAATEAEATEAEATEAEAPAVEAAPCKAGADDTDEEPEQQRRACEAMDASLRARESDDHEVSDDEGPSQGQERDENEASAKKRKHLSPRAREQETARARDVGVVA